MAREYGPEDYRDDLTRAGVAAEELEQAAQHASIHGLSAAIALWVVGPWEARRKATEVMNERFGEAGQ